MTLQVREIELFTLDLRTRMPFRYGIATLTSLPHLILRASVEIDGVIHRGLAADHLPPKWFTKNPDTTPTQDIDELLTSIRAACGFAEQGGASKSVFGLWHKIYEAQSAWGAGRVAPLLSNFGVSLVERAIIEAFCRATKQTFAQAVRTNALGIELESLHGELQLTMPRKYLPANPLRSIRVRHTVGLSDPLTDAEIPIAEKLDDGLPQSLVACIETYGLTHFKLKLAGDVDRDVHRLRDIGRLLGDRRDVAFTLDGNENYREVEAFKALWGEIRHEPMVARLIFVEQPLHRDVALSDETARALLSWNERPPMIIDESDGTFADLPRALSCGYIGTSHKNCKGVIKSIAHACLIAQRNRAGGRCVLSAEDLSTAGPISLMQDLAVIATLGITHAERNGHHYFRGLSAFPANVQRQVLAVHGDLYRDVGFATLHISNGAIDIGSAVDALFGVAIDFVADGFVALPVK